MKGMEVVVKSTILNRLKGKKEELEHRVSRMKKSRIKTDKIEIQIATINEMIEDVENGYGLVEMTLDSYSPVIDRVVGN